MTLDVERLSRTPSGHFRLSLYAAVERMAAALERLGVGLHSDHLAFLDGYLAEIRALQLGLGTLERELVLWEATAPRSLPLLALTVDAGLGLAARAAFVITGAVEEDARFMRLFEALGSRDGRPTAGALSRLFFGLHEDGVGVLTRLLDAGYVEVRDPSRPRSDRSLFVPDPVWDAARTGRLPDAVDDFHLTERDLLPALEELVLPSEDRPRLEGVVGLLEAGAAQTLLLRASPGAGAGRVVGAVARSLGLGSLAVVPGRGAERTWRRVGPLATLLSAMPWVEADLGPGESFIPPKLGAFDGARALVLGREGGARGPWMDRAVTVTLGPLGLAERREAWRQGLGVDDVELLHTLAGRFHLPAGHIERASAYARLESGVGAAGVDADHVRDACRLLNRQHLDALASQVPVAGDWSKLVVSEPTREKLHELEQRCRHRERILAHLGPAFDGATTRGVRALLSGASGTGKTLAARILASVLGMDLYRVDLAAVVNKYIGETEKNLHRVLSVAEELDVVLLLDEGDSLLGGRTEVRSANDRYANLETNYLLQRLESYQGIVVVTTNVKENIDRAFLRRMDVVATFFAPSAVERQAIWRLHLPADHTVGFELLDTIAARCALSGGQIRNAAHHATLLALERERTVGEEELERALLSEYHKAGETWPLGSRGDLGEHGVSAFVSGFAR